MRNHAAFWRLVAIGICLFAVEGCGVHSVRVVDVTHAPQFQSGYRQHEVYRLRTSACLVRWMSRLDSQNPMDVIWPVERYAEYDAKEPLGGREFYYVASLPAGTTLIIRRLEYHVDEYSFEPLCGYPMFHRLSTVFAMSDVASGMRRMSNVVAPGDINRHMKNIDGIFLTGINTDLVERIDPTTRPAQSK